MSPEGLTVAELKEMVTFLVALLFALAGAIWWLCGRLDRGCAQCAHCSARLRAEAERQRLAREELERRWGFRPLDGTKKDFEPPKKRSSGDKDGGEGRDGDG